MAKYIEKPVIVEAVQWFKVGDHDRVICDSIKPPELRATVDTLCLYCGDFKSLHGRMDTNSRYVVCPGDWMVTEASGECYPIKSATFEAKYVLVGDEVEILWPTV